jgi:broad specificity phosphatase PhoE
LARTGRIVTSAEQKAVETAAILAANLGITPEVRVRMHENDRSATGFLDGPAFEATADQFFAMPDDSVTEWERAVDAQALIVDEVELVLAGHREGDLLIVGHGAVGTLLYCHYRHLPIDRVHDQPAGGGNFFTLRMADRRILHGWRPMEAMEPARPPRGK